jgi:hypothetical protein
LKFSISLPKSPPFPFIRVKGNTGNSTGNIQKSINPPGLKKLIKKIRTGSPDRPGILCIMFINRVIGIPKYKGGFVMKSRLNEDLTSGVKLPSLDLNQSRFDWGRNSPPLQSSSLMWIL